MLRNLKSIFGIFGTAPVFSYSGATLPSALSNQQRFQMSSATSSTVTERAIVASGCFWGVEHIYKQHFSPAQGLLEARVGYIGGKSNNPSYREVCSGNTGHAEAVELVFDPAKVSYAQLIEFFYRTHDASQVNRQGHDSGTQYRSAIFTTTPEQAKIAVQVTEEVQKAHYDQKNQKIATVIAEATGPFYDAEDYHQQYLVKNPNGYECANHRLWW